MFRGKGSAEAGTLVFGSPRKLTLGGISVNSSASSSLIFFSRSRDFAHHSLLLNRHTITWFLFSASAPNAKMLAL